MAEDEIERLLREVQQSAPAPTPASSGEVARRGDRSPAPQSSGGGRVAFAVGAAVVLGPATWFAGLILPFTSAVSAGIGGAIAAFVTALVAGPPRWFSS